MRIKRTFYSTILFILFFLSLCLNSISKIHAADGDKPDNKEQPSSTLEQIITDETETSERIFSSGEDIGKDIDKISTKIAKTAGPWIKTKVFMGITWLKLFVCFTLLLVVVILERIVRYIIEKKIQKGSTDQGLSHAAISFIDALSKPLSLFILAYGTYWSFSPILSTFKSIEPLSIIYVIASKTADIIGFFAIAWFAFRLMGVVETYLMKIASKTESDIDDLLVPLVGKTLKVFIILLGGSIIIHNLTGLDLAPMLASLGIGGVALAFAAKDSIANFLGSLTIIFDKPFTVGERIVIDNYDGVVEEVGFRSTRIRTLAGHQVSIPNEKLINTTLENIGRRPHIQWLTNITITYDTPPDKVERAVEIIKDILHNHEGMHKDFPPQVYFNGFNDWSLNIMVTTWYHPANYWDYQAWLQRTCMAILRAYEAEGIEFAFPSQTNYLANDNARQLKIKLLKNEDMKGTLPG